eukprot:357425-Chlamydomonas_euryale.AAC.13
MHRPVVAAGKAWTKRTVVTDPWFKLAKARPRERRSRGGCRSRGEDRGGARPLGGGAWRLAGGSVGA